MMVTDGEEAGRTLPVATRMMIGTETSVGGRHAQGLAFDGRLHHVVLQAPVLVCTYA